MREFLTVAFVGCLLVGLPALAYDDAENDRLRILDQLFSSGSVPESSPPRAEPEMPVLLSFNGQPLSRVFEAVCKAGRFDLSLETKIADSPVTIDWGNLTLKQALVRLAETYDLIYEVPRQGHLIVRDAESPDGE